MNFDDDEEMLPLGREPETRSRWRLPGPKASEDELEIQPAYFSREYSTWWENANGLPAGSIDVACRYHIGESTYERVLEKLKHHGIEQDEDGRLVYPPAEFFGTKAFKAKMAKQNDPNARRKKRNEGLRTQREFEEYEAQRKPPTPLEELFRREREEEIKDQIAENAASNGPAPMFRARINTSNIPQQSGQPGRNQRRSPERRPPTYGSGLFQQPVHSGRHQRRSPERPPPIYSAPQQTGQPGRNQRRSPERPPPTYSPPRGAPPSYAALHGIRRRNALAVRRPRRISGPPRLPSPEFERVEHPDYDTDEFLGEPAQQTHPAVGGLLGPGGLLGDERAAERSRQNAVNLFGNNPNGLRRSNAVHRPNQHGGLFGSAVDRARDTAVSRPVRRAPSWERDNPNGRRSSIQRTPPRVEVVRDNIPNLFGYDGPPRTPQSAFSFRQTPPPTPRAGRVRRVPSNEMATRRSRSFSPSPPSTPTREPRRSSRIAAGRVQRRSP
ncbi:hypothetical protein HII31_03948 [Pseudocercospora fuligena]|uniref:Uncharacterized protein n=1 Tax=Pseudocercospora fuligena TaxID=685502 RepID=A0A8H6RLP4_9PEZI|nr:hypothetical protein HII31_03948 [Pseudocercospora fuligena]